MLYVLAILAGVGLFIFSYGIFGANIAYNSIVIGTCTGVTVFMVFGILIIRITQSISTVIQQII